MLNDLKQYRYDNNITQEEMAKKLNISASSYSLYENNKREMPFNLLIKFLEIRKSEHDKVIIAFLGRLTKIN
jgi:transcriptional regulator with XRE-family HTH domain